METNNESVNEKLQLKRDLMRSKRLRDNIISEERKAKNNEYFKLRYENIKNKKNNRCFLIFKIHIKSILFECFT